MKEGMSVMIDKKTQANADLGRLLEFIPNAGQFDLRVNYFARAKGYRLYFLRDRIIFDFVTYPPITGRDSESGQNAQAVAIALVFDNCDHEVMPKGNLPKEGVLNFFIGNDPEHWYSNLCSYGELLYSDLWPNIDLLVRSDHGELKFDWIVRPGGNADEVMMHYEGADSLEVDEEGNLLIHHALGTMTDLRPIAFQKLENGKKAVACSFVVNPRMQGDLTVGFEVGEYDDTYPLWIDPAVSYTTYLGGSGTDSIHGVAVDDTGNAYFVGQTSSADFPIVAGAYQPALAGTANAFITKIAPDGTSLIYSTYLGGSGTDNGIAIQIDSSGFAYVTGSTTSADFPTASPYQSALAGTQDAFVTKLSTDGSALVFSTYLGGATGTTTGNGIAVNVFGQTFVAGETSSASFPTGGGAFSPSYNGGASDGFVSLLSSGGSSLLASTYLGGTGADVIQGLDLDASDFVYVTGTTDSADFPATAGAYQTSLAGSTDAFITKLEEDLSALVYSTFIGGSLADEGQSVALDSANNACITGVTFSADFPVTVGAYQTALAGSSDAFITKLSSDGSSLVFSTYLGGSGADTGNAITLDSSGHVLIAGATSSADFPTTPSVIPSSLTGTQDWFISMFSSDGSNLLVSYYLGGTSQQSAYGIAVDSQGAVYVVGETDSNDFPVTAGAFQVAYAGNTDGAATKDYFATYRKASLTIMELIG